MQNIDPLTLTMLVLSATALIMALAVLWLLKVLTDLINQIRSDNARSVSGTEARLKEISEAIINLVQELEKTRNKRG